MAHTRAFLWRVILIALLLALAFSLILLYIRLRDKDTFDAYVVYTAVFEVDAAVADSLKVGDRLIDARGKEDAGEILKITREGA